MLKKIFFWLFILVLSGGSYIYAQSAGSQLQVKTSLNPGKFTIGDQFEIKITVENPGKAIIFFPSTQDNEKLSNDIEILHLRTDTVFNEKSEVVSISEILTLTCFKEGQHEVNGLSLRYQYPNDTTVYTTDIDPMFIHVASVVVDTTKAIKDIKNIRKEPITLGEIWPYLLILPTIVLIALLIVYIIKRYKANKPLIPFPSRPPLPAHQIALRDLEALRLKKLWQNERVKEYYTELTDILRIYMISRFGIHAIEMTSDEIIEALQETDGLNKELIFKMETVFRTSDLVKFAKSMPLPDEHDACHRTAVTFVEQTIPQTPAEPKQSNTTNIANTEVKE